MANSRSLKTYKLNQSVRVMSFARIAIGRIRAWEDKGFERFYVVRLPNWQADGVHLDVRARAIDLEVGHGRAERCRCVFCPGYADNPKKYGKWSRNPRRDEY